MNPPLVSVIIPTFNRAATVGRSIESVLKQSYRPMEVIVVDDGSTDNTLDVLAEYGDRIRTIQQPNGGPSSARNTGVAGAEGEIIAFLDSDDTWMPEKIAKQVDLMISGGSDIPCCVCNAVISDGDGPARTSFANADVATDFAQGFWMNPAPLVATRFILFNQVVAIRKEAFLRIGGFKEHMRLLEDHDLAFRLSLLGPWAFVSEPMVEKYNDTDGLGVQAMKNPGVHARAWAEVLKGFLKEDLGPHRNVERIVKRALNDVDTEIRAVDRIRGGGITSRMIGKAMMFSLRAKGKIRRRLPSWPRVIAVSALRV